jgi:hypothetical protein
MDAMRTTESGPGKDGGQGNPGEFAIEPGTDPASLLAMVDDERRRAVRAIEPDPRLIFGVWGVAWLVGFLLMWAGAADDSPVDLPLPVAGTLFGACLVGAVAVTIVHVLRRSAGVRGVSSRAGAMYGWAWLLSFSALTAIMFGLQRAGVSGDVTGLLWSVLSGLVVGALYLAGGALWQDTLQFRLGAWVLVASGAGAIAGYPGVYLVMGLGGGGGFLVAAAYHALRPSARGAV